jgi:hypothetical protein
LEVFQDTGNGWSQAGSIVLPPNCPGAVDALRKGTYQVTRPSRVWNEIAIGATRLRLNEHVEENAIACPG